MQKEKNKNHLKWIMRCLNHPNTILVAWQDDKDECPLCAMWEANKVLRKKINKLQEKIKKLKKDLPKEKKKRKRKKDDLAF